MKITSKGQVTIPQDVRERCGFLPGTEVEFVQDGSTLRVVKRDGPQDRGRRSDGTRIARYCFCAGHGCEHRQWAFVQA